MADVTTLPELFWPLMDVESVKLDRCAICGRRAPLNEHHIVWRSQGQLVRDGLVVPKPTITLCGEGNNLYGSGPDGSRIVYCHGKVHHRRIHFRADRGRLEYIEPGFPCDYGTALGMDGWRDVDPFSAALFSPAGGGAGTPCSPQHPGPAGPRLVLGWERMADGRVLEGDEARRYIREMFGTDQSK